MHENESETNTGSEPTQIKLELQTPLEKLWFWFFVGSVFITFSGLIGFLEDGATAFVFSLTGIGAIMSFLFWSLKRNTDNFYILDLSTRRLFYHFRFFFIKRITPARNFSDIVSITVGGLCNQGKNNVWWTYQIFALDRQGDVFALSDDVKAEERENMVLSAKKIAEITEADFVELPPQKLAKTGYSGGKPVFYGADHTFFDSVWETLTIIAGISVFMAFIGLMFAMIKLVLN